MNTWVNEVINGMPRFGIDAIVHAALFELWYPGGGGTLIGKTD